MSSRQESYLSDLITRLAQNQDDADAWKLLYRQMWPFVMAVNYRMLRGVHDLAEDASQEVFMRLVMYRNEKIFKDSKTFRAYVRAMCVNVCRDQVKRILKNGEHLQSELYDDLAEQTESKQSSPEQDAEADQLLAKILGQLPEDEQKFVEFLIEGYKLPEIAKATGLTYSNAAVRLHRLRDKIRKYLESKVFN